MGFLSTAPSRAIPNAWPPDQCQANRIHAACFQMGPRPVLGGVIYGYPVNPESVETQQATEALCHTLGSTLVQEQVGLRFIAGDFNQHDQALTSMVEWCNKGWVNAQKWAYDKFGIQVRVTCKGSTTKDHLFLSPELAAYLKSVHVEDDWFPDHSLLYAKFDSFGHPPNIPLWRQPAELPWHDCPALDPGETQQFTLPEQDPSSQYAAICHELERRVDSALRTKCKQLHKHEKGRAQTREARFVQEYAHPPKKGRAGEVQPEFHGTNLRHAQLLRQVRRLINYQRVAHVTDPSATQVEYKCSVWRKILHAPGFPGSFPHWWALQDHPEAANDIAKPPSGIAVNAIVDLTQKYLRDFENSLMRDRVRLAKQRRLTDPNVIFRDLQKEPNAQVQILLNDVKTTVSAIDEDQLALELSHPIQWNLDLPMQCKQHTFTPIHVESDKLWVDNTKGFQVGDVIRQDQPVGGVQDLFHMFGQEWKKRWDRHSTTDESEWDPICQFAATALPKVPAMPYEPITYEAWMSSLRRKTSRAATGPDAVSRQDLLKMPKDLTVALLDLLHQVEQTGCWPEQLLVGFVVALEKQPDAKYVQQFRPITVFPTAYRNYTSIRARQILQFLAPHVPITCTGNMPRKHAGHMWHSLMDQIEVGLHLESDLSGGVIDLIKAFNTRPRIPIMHIMKCLRIPDPILRAWGSATVCVQRRFKIHNKIGPPVFSSTGYAEGCALSCVAMVGFNLLNHVWCALKAPHVQLWSYVDNIEILGEDATQVTEGLQALSTFCQGMDVSIDQAKSYTWSISTEARRQLRESDHNIVHSIRDLGCHMQYTRKVTNFTVTGKCSQITPLWNKLARSLAPYRAKVRAIRSKAWPAVFHAVSAVHLADEHFTKLRTGATRGLGEHTNGMSPAIHLSLIEHPLTDPQFYAIQATVLEYRNMGNPDAFVLVMESLHRPRKTGYPSPGPASVLLARLHQVAWSWKDGTVFHDHRGLPCDVMFAPIQELRSRLAESWQNRIQTESSQRPSMAGLQRASVALTMHTVPQMHPEDQAILRTCLNGAFYTADKYYAQGKLPNANCAFCGMPDSQEHRHWQCTAFTHCRQATPDQIQTLLDLDPCLKSHGWMPEPPSLQEFRSQCVHMMPTWDHIAWPPTMPAVLHLFTDGACQAPQCPWSRLSTWGVALGQFHDLQPWPLASGVVSGWIQSSLRGELSAVIAACNAGLQCDRPLVLWIDNDLVFRRVKTMQEKGGWVKPNQKDADLWIIVQRQIQALGPRLQQVCKVVSHQDHAGADSNAEQWIFAGNDAADALATAAIANYPALQQTWNTLQSDLGNLRVLRQAVHQTLIKVGRHAIYSKSKPQQTESRGPRITQDDIPEFALPDFRSNPVADLYSFEGVETVCRWLETLVQQPESPKLISWFQLNALFEHQTGLPGVINNTKTKQWSCLACRTQQNFVQRTNRLSRWIQGVVASSGGSCRPRHLRPQSQAVQFWTQCLRIRLSGELLDLADRLLSAHQPHYNSVQSLRGI